MYLRSMKKFMLLLTVACWAGMATAQIVFRIKPESGLEWAVVNGTEWFKNWQNDNGIYTLRVTPRKAGMMMLCVRMTEKPPKFIFCLMYDVVK